MSSPKPSVFQKLNLKDQTDIVVLDAPASFEKEIDGLEGVKVRRRLTGVKEVDFALAFVTTKSQVDAAARGLTSRARGDALVWLAYPKGTSRRYTCEFNRDTGFDVLGQAGFEGVRMVAIDEDWSALRFRRAEFIKTLRRAPERALSREGRQRVAARKK